MQHILRILKINAYLSSLVTLVQTIIRDFKFRLKFSAFYRLVATLVDHCYHGYP